MKLAKELQEQLMQTHEEEMLKQAIEASLKLQHDE